MRYTDYKFHVPEENVGMIAAHYGKRREDGMERCYRDPERVLYAAVRPG